MAADDVAVDVELTVVWFHRDRSVDIVESVAIVGELITRETASHPCPRIMWRQRHRPIACRYRFLRTELGQHRAQPDVAALRARFARECLPDARQCVGRRLYDGEIEPRGYVIGSILDDALEQRA